MNSNSWRKYGLEFLSIFVAVILALALNNWNDNRRDRITEDKILSEIRNGLIKDIEDIELNVFGHKEGMKSISYWTQLIYQEEVNLDSFPKHYFGITRDFVSIQNRSGYESLKSKGLDLIQDDDLRIKIISLYEYDFATLEKLEESYAETQFHRSYFHAINDLMAPYLGFDEIGQIRIARTVAMPEIDRVRMQSILWKIATNRGFVLAYYQEMQTKVEELVANIEEYLQ
ncbi:MAG: hypothetical protein AAF433_18800 [Bacteroidota bacterium]